MANDRKPSGLCCQKCRAPIEVDASIDQLNPAAFKLLTGRPSLTPELPYQG
jgi:beclin 1